MLVETGRMWRLMGVGAVLRGDAFELTFEE